MNGIQSNATVANDSTICRGHPDELCIQSHNEIGTTKFVAETFPARHGNAGESSSFDVLCSSSTLPRKFLEQIVILKLQC